MRISTLGILAATAIVILSIHGCNNKGKTQEAPAMEVKTTTIDKPDSMVYGLCGEGTAMNTVELVTGNGDSCTYTLTDGETDGDVFGGLEVGDSIAVLSQRTVNGTKMANKVVNITSLVSRWVSLSHTLTLSPNGKAATKTNEAEPLTEWKLYNGHLLVGRDTFDIVSLGPDSLYLKRKGSITGYRRMNE